MGSEKRLKEKLSNLSEKKFQLNENDDLSTLIPAMLIHIGTTDAELRDNLIYGAFVSWVMRDDVIEHEELQKVFKELLDEKHLFLDIGEKDTDSIFCRSFSVLWLPPILINHRKEAFLSENDIKEGLEKLLLFLHKEKDRRGFVEGKGWAHAFAHAGDALDDFALCTELGKEELEKILKAIQKAISVSDYAYAHGEDERMITPVLAIIQRQLLPSRVLSQWVSSFEAPIKKTKAMPDGIILRANIKNFLQSLYFRLKWNELSEELLPPIEKTLREISKNI